MRQAVATGLLAEFIGGLVVEVGAPFVIAASLNSHGDIYTLDLKRTLRMIHTELSYKTPACATRILIAVYSVYLSNFGKTTVLSSRGWR